MENKENLKTIKEWNDIFLRVLLEYRETHPDFKFVLRQRDVNNRLSHGYWFQGNENYTFIGFFDRSGGTNMTRSLGFVVEYNDQKPSSCYIELVYNNETDKTVLKAYKRISEEIDGFTKITDSKFYRYYSSNDILANLNEFVTIQFPAITSIVHELKLETKLLISETKFNKILANTLSIRGKIHNTTGILSLKPLIDAFEQWYASSGHRKNEDLYKDSLNLDYLQGLSKKAFIDFFFDFARNGGGIQTQGYRTAPKFLETLEADYKNTRAFLMEPFNQNFDVNGWLKRISNFNGIGPGIATIYLHRVNKKKYCVVNNKSAEGFTKIGFPIKGNLTDQFSQIHDASTNLIEAFPTLKNFYKTDALTHFIIGTEEGKKIADELTGKVNYWVFQGNPNIYRVVDALKDGKIKTWSVSAHKTEIRIGDKVILWVTGEKSGCYALCTVTSAVENIKEDVEELKYYTDKSDNEIHDRVQIEIEHNWWDQPVLFNQLSSLPDFDNLNVGMRGTNFSATRGQYEKLLDLHWEHSLINKIRVIADRNKVEQFLDLLALAVDEFELENDNPRISFSTPKSPTSYISATIGQRYIISLENKTAETPAGFELALIAARKYEEVFKNGKGFKKFGDFSSTSPKSEPPFYAYYDESALPVDEDLIQAWLSTIKTELTRVEISSHRQYHNPFYYKAVVDAEYRKYILDKIFKSENHMNDQALNQILYGPPGTGKTYNTINEAIKIVDNGYYLANISNRVKLQERFNELLIKNWEKTDGQISFCTFHQSFSYEDFVEGIKPLKPENEDKSVKYDIIDGIFKKICRLADASNNALHIAKENLISLTQDDFNKAFFYKVSLGDINKEADKDIYEYCISNGVIAIGHGERYDFTGKGESEVNQFVADNKLDPYTSLAMNYFKNYLKVGNYVVISNGISYIRALGKVTGEYEYKPDAEILYKHFRKVEWIFKNVEIPVSEFYQTNLKEQTIYKLKSEFIIPSFFIRSQKPADSEIQMKNFVLVIDEINRGNVSSIFGELITLIEPNKRSGKLEALEVVLPYSKERFNVPYNVHIIGTMNTADRSIEALDTALRRRFTFHEIKPKPELIAEIGKSKGIIGNIDLVKMLDTINNRIEKLIDKDHKIGHSYMLDIVSLDDLKTAFNDKIIPLLEEYFYGDFGKIGLVLGEKFVNLKYKDKKDFSFAKFGLVDRDIIDDLSERKVFEISDAESWDESCFTSIYQS